MITSTSNQQIKKLSALMKKAKQRREEKSFVVEGWKMFQEAPKDWIKEVYVAESAVEQMEEEFDGCQYEIVSDSVFKAVSDTQTPQGVIAVIQMPDYQLEDLLKGEKTSLLLLESIQDPGNLGTMMRTGEGAGITGIILNKTTVDLFNPKTIRSTMGSIYRVPFYVAEDFPAVIQRLQEKKIKLYAAHLQGTKQYDEPDYKGACGFLIGNEGNGLSQEIAKMADEYIKIPMEGQVESLNAAISASLLMYEVQRQRRH